MRLDTSEVRGLSRDLTGVGARALPAMAEVIEKGAAKVQRKWRANARVSAGSHGKHYPRSITHDVKFSRNAIIAEIGPDPAKKQGGMAFEYGSVNQPPHLDGNRAMDEQEPRIDRDIGDALDRLMDTL